MIGRYLRKQLTKYDEVESVQRKKFTRVLARPKWQGACGFLALTTNLVQFQGQHFVKNSTNMALWESSDCFCEPMLFSVLLLHCFESQSNGLFLTSKHVSILRADQFHITTCEIYFKEKYTKGLSFTEETVCTTMRNAKEGDVWKMGQSQLLVFKQNVGVKFHLQKRFPYSYVWQPSRSSIQQTCRPKVSSFMARMK